MASTRISAVLVTSCKSFVFEWQTVTVQWCHFRRSAIGEPTILLRPTTTALAPSIFTPLLLMSSMQPYGVQGNIPLKSPIDTLPWLTVLRLSKGRGDRNKKSRVVQSHLISRLIYPSTSFSGWTELVIKSASIGWAESSGICTMMPCTVGSLFNSLICQLGVIFMINYRRQGVVGLFILREIHRTPTRSLRNPPRRLGGAAQQLATHLEEEFAFSDRWRHLNVLGRYSYLVGRLQLHPNVHIRVEPIAHLHDGETWAKGAQVGHHFFDACLKIRANVSAGN